MRCRLLLSMIAVSVRRSVSLFGLSVTQLNSAARAVCAGSFSADFAKSLWPSVDIQSAQEYGNKTEIK